MPDRLQLEDSEKMNLSSAANIVSVICIFQADADRLVCRRARELHNPLDKRVVRARFIKFRSVAHRFHPAAVPHSCNTIGVQHYYAGAAHTARSFAASATAELHTWPASIQFAP